MGFLSSYLKGQQSLKNSFWYLMIMGSAIYLVLAFTLINLILTPPKGIVMDAQISNYYGVFTLINAKEFAVPYIIAGFILLLYLLFTGFCVFRSANNDSRKFLGILAKIAVAFIIFDCILRIALLFGLYFGNSNTAPFPLSIIFEKPRQQMIFQIDHPVATVLPIVSNDQVTQIAKGIIILLNSYDYTNFQTIPDRAKNYFSRGGWEIYNAYLHGSVNAHSLNLHEVKMNVSAIDPPQIAQQADTFGKHYWMVFVHANFTIESLVKPGLWLANVQDRYFYILFAQPKDSSNIYVEGFIDES